MRVTRWSRNRRSCRCRVSHLREINRGREKDLLKVNPRLRRPRPAGHDVEVIEIRRELWRDVQRCPRSVAVEQRPRNRQQLGRTYPAPALAWRGVTEYDPHDLEERLRGNDGAYALWYSSGWPSSLSHTPNISGHLKTVHPI